MSQKPLALHAAAFNGIPDPVFPVTARAMGILTGLAEIEPDPRAPDHDVIFDAALRAATGLAKLLGFRRGCTTVSTQADEAKAIAKLTEAAAELSSAAEAVNGLLELARMTDAAGRSGKRDLNWSGPEPEPTVTLRSVTARRPTRPASPYHRACDYPTNGPRGHRR